MSQEQAKFKATYITSSEICEELGVTRSAIMHARRGNRLPGAIEIKVGNWSMTIWERSGIRPYIDAWKETLGPRVNA